MRTGAASRIVGSYGGCSFEFATQNMCKCHMLVHFIGKKGVLLYKHVVCYEDKDPLQNKEQLDKQSQIQ